MAEFTLSNFQTVSDMILPSLVYLFRSNAAFVKERESILRILSSLGSLSTTEFCLAPLVQADIRDVDCMSEFDSEETVQNVFETDRATEVIPTFFFSSCFLNQLLTRLVAGRGFAGSWIRLLLKCRSSF
jgi:hypothetical protein